MTVAPTLYLSPVSLILQAFSNSGAVLASGKINLYQAGTTTAVTTYSDPAMTSTNANPIVLNSSGRLPTAVWVPSGTPVKMVLTDASNNVLLTQDNLSAINDPWKLYPQTEAEDAASVTPTNLAYPPGNVLRYGAIPLGNATTNTNAFLAALSVVSQDVYIPTGKYAINRDLEFASKGNRVDPNEKVWGRRIYGDGPQLSVIDLQGAVNGLVATDEYPEFSMSDLGVIGDASTLDAIWIRGTGYGGQLRVS